MAEIDEKYSYDKAKETLLTDSPVSLFVPVAARAPLAFQEERLPNIRLTPLEERVFTLAKPYLEVKENERHTRNALEFSMSLLETYAGDREVVVPAIILHDVGWSLSEETVNKTPAARHDRLSLVQLHEEQGVRIAQKILHDLHYDDRVATEVIDIIGGHDTRTSALSLNDEIVKDADKLTRYSDSFWFILRESSTTRDNLIGFLDQAIDKSFFLDLSKSMARAALALRRREDWRD